MYLLFVVSKLSYTDEAGLLKNSTINEGEVTYSLLVHSLSAGWLAQTRGSDGAVSPHIHDVQMSDDEFYLEDSSEEEEEEEDGEEGFEIDDGLQFSGEEGVDSVGGMQVAPPPTSCQTLTPDMISKKMFDIIHEVNAVFQVCTYLCPLLSW